MVDLLEREFYLTIVRHGQTTANVLKNIQGHLNTPLTDLGIEQASTLGKYFCTNGPKKFHRVYTSDLGRAQETCEIILSHLAQPQISDINNNHDDDATTTGAKSIVVKDARLRERKYGVAYEGKPIAQLKSEAFALGFNEGNFTMYTPEGSESMAQVKQRVADFCRDTLLVECQQDEEVLLISHWATIKEILKLFQPKANDSIRREHLLETPNTAFSRFKIRCKSTVGKQQHQHQQTGTIDNGCCEQPEAEQEDHERSRPENLVSIKTISLHQIPHLSSNQTSVNMRQQVE